jgi:hypothetical protein
MVPFLTLFIVHVVLLSFFGVKLSSGFLGSQGDTAKGQVVEYIIIRLVHHTTPLKKPPSHLTEVLTLMLICVRSQSLERGQFRQRTHCMLTRGR